MDGPLVCFKVEKVIGVSSDGNYQVQWAPAWVSKFHLVGCEHLIKEFLQQQEQQQAQQQHQQQQQQQHHHHHQQQQQQQQQQEDEDQISILLPGVTNTHVDSEPNFSLILPESIKTETDATEVQLDNTTWTETIAEDTANHQVNTPYHVPTDSLHTTKSDSLHTTSGEISDVDNSFQPHQTYTNVDISSDEHIGGERVDLFLGASAGMEASASNVLLGSNFNRNKSDLDEGRQKYPTQQEEKKHVCSICSKGFLRAFHLLEHTRTHTGERPHRCDTCQRSFATKSQLRRHLVTHESGVSHTCDECGKMFSRSDRLRMHVRRVHGRCAMSTCH